MFVCSCCCGFVVVAVVVCLFVFVVCLFVVLGFFNYLLGYIFIQVLRANTELTKPEIVKRTSPF